MYSKVKLFGHPLHVMLIAYPIAFYTGTLVSFIVYGATQDQFWLKMAIALNLAGVVMAVLAALPGFIDWAVGIPNESKAKRTGLIHMLLNVTALTLFTISLLMFLDEWNAEGDVSAMPGIILTGLGVLSTIIAGFHGWMLVQDHHVGVKLTPEQERIEPTEIRRAG